MGYKPAKNHWQMCETILIGKPAAICSCWKSIKSLYWNFPFQMSKNNEPKACNDVYLQKKIASRYKCQVPIFYTGKHLDFYNATLPTCNNSVIETILDKSEHESTCLQSVPCKHTDYSIDGAFLLKKVQDCSYSRFRLTYKQLYQENYNSYIAVELGDFIGEVGGILGITVGWSGTYLIEMFFENVYNIIRFL